MFELSSPSEISNQGLCLQLSEMLAPLGIMGAPLIAPETPRTSHQSSTDGFKSTKTNTVLYCQDNQTYIRDKKIHFIAYKLHFVK